MRTPPAGVSEVGAPDAELASDAIKMAAAYVGALGDRRGDLPTLIVDRRTPQPLSQDLCGRIGVRQSMGRVGSCFDKGVAS